MGIIKQAVVFILLACSPAFAADYYFTVPTDNKGGASDKATAVATKFSPGNVKIYYGKGIAIVYVSAEVEPIDKDATKLDPSKVSGSLEGISIIKLKKAKK